MVRLPLDASQGMDRPEAGQLTPVANNSTPRATAGFSARSFDMPDDVRNVFISHAHEDDHRLEPLKELLASNGIAARDSSITSEKPNAAKNNDYIMNDILAPRIDWAGVVMVLITPDTKESTWVDREIRYAQEQEKRIVGIWDEDQQGCDVPEALEEFESAIVPWDAALIIKAAFGEVEEWLEPNGSPRAPRGKDLPRETCR
jgi:hypothetical protein